MEDETGIGKASSLQILLLDFSFHFSVSAIVTILLVSGDDSSDRRPASVLSLAENCKEAHDPYGGGLVDDG